MTDLNLDIPPDREELPLPDWCSEIKDTYHELFYFQRWKEDEKWAAFFDVVAKRARYSYIIEGMVVLANKYYKLYQDRGYKTFEEYRKKEVKKSKWQCNQLVKAAKISWHLICQGFEEIPNCVSQAIRLLESAIKRDKHEPDVVGGWERCVEAAQEADRHITANFIEAVVTENPEEKRKQVNLPIPVYKGLEKKAKRLGMTLAEYLKKLAQEEESEPPQGPTPEGEHLQNESFAQNNNTTEHDTRTSQTVFTDQGKLGGECCAEILRTRPEFGVCYPEPPY
ncbi:MAG: hypothetical protein F6K22_38560 [Okeania sp. SIO2F4]|uniref:hypothetical protein n=1 Tax=Okeania sp. SIO2F4 TaxID=2607790 RepID=UPI00142C4EE7|nr:hypothetical protein [Okeania sp. SIO2F4]NES08161.1 hypothetical protein [Okeania sp. SIO2F4]